VKDPGGHPMSSGRSAAPCSAQLPGKPENMARKHEKHPANRAGRRYPMSPFRTEELQVNGCKIVMLTAGDGPPLMFWHGAGTFTGFDFALPWTAHFKVMIPFHPGFGLSESDPHLSSMHDYILHYLDLLDLLGLDKINLVGFSLGGWMAATFACEHAHRLRKLVLVAPPCLPVPENPAIDVSRLQPQEVAMLLASDFNVVLRHLPQQPDPVFEAAGKQERASVARIIAGEGPVDRKLPHWLHRVRVPCLIVWGNEDRLVPAAHAAEWSKLIAGSAVRTFDGAGHLVFDEKPEAVQAVTDFLM
jgi:pimeloyl-ACP methyl ester carboxylesterase